jgi:hypothetical protein
MQAKVEIPEVGHGGPLPITRVWLRGVPLGAMMTEAAYGTDLDGYRRCVVNHEFGHAIGGAGTPAARRQEIAPVMLQQSYRLDGRTPNPWLYP